MIVLALLLILILILVVVGVHGQGNIYRIYYYNNFLNTN